MAGSPPTLSRGALSRGDLADLADLADLGRGALADLADLGRGDLADLGRGDLGDLGDLGDPEGITATSGSLSGGTSTAATRSSSAEGPCTP
jgi:hypothetical protein